MNVKLDRFGRVVLPKAVRDDLDLDAGDILTIEEVEDGILLRPVRDEPHLVEKDGVLVFTGTPTEDVGAALQKLRNARLTGLVSKLRRR